ncbi:Uncharacterised protein [Enterobacter hormaechei]|nr:Uncharacterised protein [Enterobacter hormaechei]SAF46581.1 Uncharacterised protein [Enterobacter cloacae]SYP44669.1 Uncharacterised protein [Klebsiella pneumoniae]SAB82841.1 Uncharacterised protein [Enterobacter hormaechei]SAH73604.1 Uncharacterised protein [Enterobacter hormaechei]
MVSHVWLTMRSIPFVRWLMAEDSIRSWSWMAALILFSLSFSSALTDFSCSLNAAFSISPVVCCCTFDFCSKSFASVKRLFIDGSLQSDVSPPVRVGNADAAFCGANHLKTCAFQRLSDVLTRFQLPGRG